MSEFRRLGERLVYQGYIWRVVNADFESPTGERFERDIVRSPGAVAVLPIGEPDPESGERTVVLVEQFRAAYERAIVEAPAGMRDVADEPIEVTAARELAEEVGLAAARLEPLGSFLPSVGMTDSVTHLFAAFGLSEVGQDVHGPEEQHMAVVRVTLTEAVAMVLDGRIDDAKTVIAILRAERLLRPA